MSQRITTPGLVSLIKKVPHSIKLMGAVMFFFEFGFGFTDPWWSIYIDNITQNYWLTGLFISLFSLAGLVLALPLGQVIDHFDHKAIIRGSLLMYLLVASLYFIAGYTNSITVLIVAILINGLSSIIIYETSQAYVDRHYQGDKSFNYSFYVSLDAFGYFIGTLAVLAIISWWPIYYGYLVVALFVLITLLLENRLPPTSSNTLNLRHLLRDLFSSGYFKKALQSLPHYSIFFYWQILLIFTLFFINFGYQVFIPLFGMEQNLSLVQIGLVSIFFQLPILLSIYYATWLEKVTKRTLIVGLFLVLCLLMIFFVFNHSQLFFLLVSFLVASTITILNITIRPVIFSLSPERLEGEASAITNTSVKLATISAPLVVGILASWRGFVWSYYLFACLALAMAVVAWFAYSKMQLKPRRVERLTKSVHRSGN